MKAYKHLVKYCLSKNCIISVWDGEEWQIKRSKSYKEIKNAIESVEEANITIRDADTKEIIAIAVCSAFGLEDDETVVDYSDNHFMNQWWDAYQI